MNSCRAVPRADSFLGAGVAHAVAAVMWPCRIWPILVGLLINACADDGASDKHSTAILPAAHFGEFFAKTDSVLLEQPFEHPIVFFSGFDRTSDGRLVVTDRSEGRISIFDSDGSFLRTFGGRGQGPGEFQILGEPRVDASDRIHVADPAQRRISIFSSEGVLIREVRLPLGFLVWEMELSQGGYLLTVRPDDPTAADALLHIDSTGAILGTALPIAHATPPGERATPRWMSVNTTRLTVRSDTAFVVSAILDSLWIVSPEGVIKSRAITVPGYEAPHMPDPEPRTAVEITEWAKELTMIPAIRGRGRILVIPFARGRYEEVAAPTVAAFRDSGGRWHSLMDTPVVVGSDGHQLITLERPSLEDIVLAIYSYIGA